MKKFPFKRIAFSLVALLTCLQSIAQTPASSAKTEPKTVYDTVIVRLNSKLYYTVTVDKKWQLDEKGKITFSTYNINDTLPDINMDYISSKPSLVKRLRKGDTIQYCLFGEMKLSFYDFMDETQKKNGVHNICSRPLVFLNCVFNRILADTTESLYEDDSQQKKKLKFTQNIMFLNCNFIKGLELSDCIFQKKFFLTGQITSSSASAIDGCEFDDLCYIFSAPDYNKGSSWLKMNSCVFNSPCIFSVSDNEQTHITIERCKFRDVFSLGKSIPQNTFKRFHATPVTTDFVGHTYKYDTYYANFLKNKFTKEYYITDDSIEAFMPVTHPIYNVSFIHCKAKIIDIANATMMDCSMEDVAILYCLDATGSSFTYSSSFAGKEALEDVNFPNNNCIIYASYKTFSPEAFKLGIYLEKIQVHPLVHNYFDSTSDFMQDNSNFFNMIEDYAAKKFTNQDMVTTLKARYEHEKATWERSYHAAHIAHSTGAGDFIASFFQWSLGWFLEITVSTGYKGELKFGLWVVFIILFFSFIFFFRHRGAVIDYLNSKFNNDEINAEKFPTLKVYGSLDKFRDFARCFWFSCMVFVDPRLPISFFNLRVGLFGLVLAEWLCGLTAILLFLIFLASNYPFIHSLIGI
jgi:hypothetical protein